MSGGMSEDTLSLSINGKKYDIKLGDEFEAIMDESVRGVFDLNRDNDVKVLIQAYFKKSYEHLELKRDLQTLLQKFDSLQN